MDTSRLWVRSAHLIWMVGYVMVYHFSAYLHVLRQVAFTTPFSTPSVRRKTSLGRLWLWAIEVGNPMQNKTTELGVRSARTLCNICFLGVICFAVSGWETWLFELSCGESRAARIALWGRALSKGLKDASGASGSPRQKSPADFSWSFLLICFVSTGKGRFCRWSTSLHQNLKTQDCLEIGPARRGWTQSGDGLNGKRNETLRIGIPNSRCIQNGMSPTREMESCIKWSKLPHGCLTPRTPRPRWLNMRLDPRRAKQSQPQNKRLPVIKPWANYRTASTIPFALASLKICIENDKKKGCMWPFGSSVVTITTSTHDKSLHKGTIAKGALYLPD